MKLREYYDTEIERQIDFVLALHEVVSGFGAEMYFDEYDTFGYGMADDESITINLIDYEPHDWEVIFSVIPDDLERKLVTKNLSGKLDPVEGSAIHDFGYLCFRVHPDGESNWEVVGTTVPKSWGLKDAKRFPIESVEIDF